jgi:hypothetical protein
VRILRHVQLAAAGLVSAGVLALWTAALLLLLPWQGLLWCLCYCHWPSALLAEPEGQEWQVLVLLAVLLGHRAGPADD